MHLDLPGAFLQASLLNPHGAKIAKSIEDGIAKAGEFRNTL